MLYVQKRTENDGLRRLDGCTAMKSHLSFVVRPVASTSVCGCMETYMNPQGIKLPETNGIDFETYDELVVHNSH